MTHHEQASSDPDRDEQKRLEWLDEVRGMALLPEEMKDKLPDLYTSENAGLDTMAQVKYFTPDAGWTWYATEFDGHDLFFGLVVGLEIELGYFSLQELRGLQGPTGLPIERDLYFEPKTLAELIAMHRKQRDE